MKYAANMITYDSAGYKTLGADAEKIMARLEEFGYDGIEIIGIPENITRINRVKELLSSYRLEPVLVTGAWGRYGAIVHTYPEKDPTSPIKKRRDLAVEYIRECSKMARAFGSGHVLVALGALSPQDTSENGISKARTNLVDVLKRSSRHARDNGVRLLLEPQCRFEGYYGVNSTVRQCEEVLRLVGEDNIDLMVDTFHANIEEASIPGAVRKAGKNLRHVHVADNNRLAPGMGSIDFKSIMEELMRAGYVGYLGVECMPARPDPDTLVKQGISYLKAIEPLARFRSSEL